MLHRILQFFESLLNTLFSGNLRRTKNKETFKDEMLKDYAIDVAAAAVRNARRGAFMRSTSRQAPRCECHFVQE